MLALIVIAAAWIVVRGILAKGHLNSARGDVATIKQALLSGDSGKANLRLAVLQHDTGRAQALTGDPVWAAATHLPWVGSALRSARGVAVSVNTLAHQSLPDVLKAGAGLSPKSLQRSSDTVDLSRFTSAVVPLGVVADELTATRREVSALPARTAVAQVDHARTELLRQLGGLVGTVRTAILAARVAPGLLGADGPRRYFMAIQTPAEARGTGGISGAFGILVADHGRMHITRLGSDAELHTSPIPLVKHSAEYDHLYKIYKASQTYQNANVSPHFPYAGENYKALWERQTGQHIDGVIAIDPELMSRLLAVTGPVRLKTGERVTSRNAVALVEKDAYTRFDDVAVRKTFFQSVGGAVVDAVLSRGTRYPTALLHVLGRSAGDGRLRLWSARPQEEQQLATTPLAGVLPRTTAPFAAVVINNAAESKLDYYLERSVRYAGGPCGAGPVRTTTVTVVLGNTAPPTGLPDYVVIRGDHPSVARPRGAERVLVSLYGTQGAGLFGVQLDGKPATAGVGVERGHPVFTADVDIDPGASRTLTYRLSEPTSPGRPTSPVQPLTLSQKTVVTLPECHLTTSRP